MSEPSAYHYVIVRKDLPAGVAAAMIVHAAGESGGQPARAVVLGVPNEGMLAMIHLQIMKHGLKPVLVEEVEGPFAGQLMAIGIPLQPERIRFLQPFPLYTGPSHSAPLAQR